MERARGIQKEVTPIMVENHMENGYPRSLSSYGPNETVSTTHPQVDGM